MGDLQMNLNIKLYSSTWTASLEKAWSYIDKWVTQSQTDELFKEKDNLTAEEAELLKLRKEIEQL